MLAVAGELGSDALNSCQPSGPVGTVIVHGTGDLLTPYTGAVLLYAAVPDIHEHFRQVNGCTGKGDSAATLPTPASTVLDPINVTVSYTGHCDDQRRDYLVTVFGGGHNWPGGDVDDSTLTTLGLLGAHTRNFDATLQGYDLLVQAGGD